MRATVLTIGDELLIGQIVDTNAAWIGERLTVMGIRPIRLETVGDEQVQMREALARAMRDGRVTVVTGGLGPTHDDLTREVVASLFNAPLREDPALVEGMRRRFERRGMQMPASNRVQALVPDGFEAIPNPVGTAPALVGSYPHPQGDGLIVLLPGVPYEMQAFMQDHMLGRIAAMDGAPEVLQRTLLTVGISESALADLLDGAKAYLHPETSLAFLPNLRGVRLRLTAVGPDAASRLEDLATFIHARAEKWIYGEGQDTLEAAVGRLLKERNLTVATAESCTGGFVAHRLTDVPGSSEWVIGGVVAYANSVKQQQLGVRSETLGTFGAVSRQTACEMADGVRRLLGSDVGISTTGIMGPGGGSEGKPVGTFWMGISSSKRTVAVDMALGMDRIRNKERASTAVLDLLRRELQHFG
ncbi:MAG: competence/damage-inducible protein A [Bacteroidetes bacterium]|nr:competence/damage-inducible protein A [Bacteroidota bacterium]